MADGAFDVLETLDGLRSAGFSDAQARALADSLQHVVSSRQGDLVTKGDLHVTEANLRSEIAGLRAEMVRAMADQQRWTIGIIAGLLGVLFAALKLL